MKLQPIVDGITEDLRRAGAVGGEETARVAELLVASVETAVRLHILDALHEAAKELAESVPDVEVDVRLEGRDPVLSISLADTAEPSDGEARPSSMADYLDDELARLTLRLPEGLKGQVEGVASQAGASINSWIVTALANALDGPSSAGPHRGRMPRRMTGYVRG